MLKNFNNRKIGCSNGQRKFNDKKTLKSSKNFNLFVGYTRN